MKGLEALANRLERLIHATGEGLKWLVLLMVLLTLWVVVSRYLLSSGSIAMQELINYLHGTLFMLGVAYAVHSGAHVRVDIFYQRFSARTRAWVDALGCLLFLIPLCLFTLLISQDFVTASWAIGERSAEPGGLPAVFLLKSLIPAMSVLLLLSALAQLLRHTVTLMQGEVSDE